MSNLHKNLRHAKLKKLTGCSHFDLIILCQRDQILKVIVLGFVVGEYSVIMV